MTDDPTTPDDGPEPHPDETELISYLDGELDAAAARKVEAKLAADPALRARAAALKRSFDLLDFLPKPEASRDFTTRTLDKLPAVKSSPENRPVPVTAPAPARSSVPMAVPVNGSPSHARPAVPAPSRGWVWAFGVLFAAGLALGAGYVGTALTRSRSLPPVVKETPPDDPLADHRAIENLPLYAAADDLAFVERLAGPEFFGDDPAVAFEGPRTNPIADKTDGKHFEPLAKAFKALPAERQEQVRRLDHQLHEKGGSPTPLFRVLEAYAVWLDRLPDNERKPILAAATPEKRLAAVQDARRSQWLANLPAVQRKQLDNLPPADRAALIAQWRAEEEQRQEAWQSARHAWETTQSRRVPWPFDDEAMRKDVLEFARVQYRPDDAKRSRLNELDHAKLREALNLGEKDGQWAWLGALIVGFNRPDPVRNVPRYELLPEPGSGKPVTEIDQLWEKARQHYEKKGPKGKIEAKAGRWPDFALAVWDDVERSKQFTMPANFALGPSRPAEFRPEVQRAIAALERRAPGEWSSLKSLEGKWPEYPRRLMELARQHDVWVAGAMPPGSPRRWEETYNPRPRPPLPVRPAGGE